VREKTAIGGKISQLAECQQGYAARRQLLALGVSRHTIASHVANGEWTARYAAVYAIGHRSPGPIPEAAAAVLACGEDAVLSHDSAAALWGLSRWPPRHEVIAPYQRRRRGIVSHRSTTLDAHDITVHWGITVTTPVRTMCDIAPRRTADQLLKSIDDARIAGYLGPVALGELVRRCPRVRHLIGANPSRSKLERDWRRFARHHHLPPHELNVHLHGYEVDIHFPAQHLVVELDGWHFHRGPSSFRSDRVRDTGLKDHGIDTIRLTADRLTDAEAARLKRILAAQVSGDGDVL
jgi:very-short-patch-repair endonuclease